MATPSIWRVARQTPSTIAILSELSKSKLLGTGGVTSIVPSRSTIDELSYLTVTELRGRQVRLIVTHDSTGRGAWAWGWDDQPSLSHVPHLSQFFIKGRSATGNKAKADVLEAIAAERANPGLYSAPESIHPTLDTLLGLGWHAGCSREWVANLAKNNNRNYSGANSVEFWERDLAKYQSDPTYRAYISTRADLLPLYIDGDATLARKVEQARQAQAIIIAEIEYQEQLWSSYWHAAPEKHLEASRQLRKSAPDQVKNLTEKETTVEATPFTTDLPTEDLAIGGAVAGAPTSTTYLVSNIVWDTYATEDGGYPAPVLPNEVRVTIHSNYWGSRASAWSTDRINATIIDHLSDHYGFNVLASDAPEELLVLGGGRVDGGHTDGEDLPREFVREDGGFLEDASGNLIPKLAKHEASQVSEPNLVEVPEARDTILDTLSTYEAVRIEQYGFLRSRVAQAFPGGAKWLLAYPKWHHDTANGGVVIKEEDLLDFYLIETHAADDNTPDWWDWSAEACEAVELVAGRFVRHGGGYWGIPLFRLPRDTQAVPFRKLVADLGTDAECVAKSLSSVCSWDRLDAFRFLAEDGWAGDGKRQYWAGIKNTWAQDHARVNLILTYLGHEPVTEQDLIDSEEDDVDGLEAEEAGFYPTKSTLGL